MRVVGLTWLLVALTSCAINSPPTPSAYSPSARAADSVAALEAFRSNIASIHARDRTAYLRHYLQSPRLARTGADGVAFGYEALASGDPDAWPDTLVATHLEVTPLSPGVVYGVYRYRVTTGASTRRGVSERVLVKQPDGSWKISVSTAFDSPGKGPTPALAISGATIVDGTGAAARVGAVVMRDGRIACVGDCPTGPDVEVIDARGRWVIPGLVDAHVHYSQTGWADGRPDALDVRGRFPYDAAMAALQARPERFFRSHLCAGVTATFDVGGYPWTLELRERTVGSTAAPNVAAAGPLLSAREPEQLNLPAMKQFVLMADEDATRRGARMLEAWRSDAVKVWFLVGATTPDTAAWVGRLRTAGEEARRMGRPLIVHATTLWAAKHALRAGAKLLVHSVEDLPVDEEFLRLAREAGASYNPTLTVREGYVQLRERRFQPRVPLECVDPETRYRAFLTDSIPGAVRDPEYRQRINATYRLMLQNLKRVHEAGIPVVLGSDAGNPLTLHGPAVYPEMEAMAEAGLTPMQVLVASTRDAARAMGREDIGTLEVGKIADLVVLERDPLTDIRNVRSVRLVVRAGESWTREELEYRSR
ncbi:MAG: amidohydrolase family protein [Gemmatimonadetes bacterium]|nr:amidohydrolase family protein [Gemmatimonadota bacterium]